MIKTHTHYTLAFTAELEDGSTIDLPYQASEIIDPFLSEDGNTFRYAVSHDDYVEYEWQEGVEFIQANPGYMNYLDADAVPGWRSEMEEDHDVYVVDVYDHGSTTYSLRGEGVQCRWDTASGGAMIAIPNENHESPFTDTREAASGILAEYTAWCNGEIYGIIEMTRTASGWEEAYAIWGFIGDEYASSTVKSGY